MTDPITKIAEAWRGLLPDTLGLELIDATPERVTAKLLVRKEICTLGGFMHGGAYMAFADTLGAVGTILNLEEGVTTTTIESKTNFLGGAALGSTVIGESTPLHRGRTTMVWQTQIKNEKGKLLAVVMQTQLVIRKA